MEKNVDLWVRLRPTLTKQFRKLKNLILIIAVSITSVSAAGNYSDVVNANGPGAEIQQQKITGRVTDKQNGNAMPGVNVQVKGTGYGAITDADGRYSISSVDRNAILVFSFIGYETIEIPVNGKDLIDVSLAENLAMLDEIVVVGYSTKRLSELSSSVSVVSEKELQTAPVSPNLSVMLQGRVPGLIVSNTSGMPGSGATMTIRGAGSMGASTSPLIVVDGMIGGSYDPQDVESVTVLKDAAATGIYGSRAANGVIVITTKTGRSGDFRVSVSSTTGPTFNWDDRVKLHNSASLYEQQTLGLKNLFDLRVAEGHPDFVGANFEEYRDNVVPPSVLNTDTDWYDLLNGPGFINRSQIAMSGGTERTTFYVSGNLNYEKGTIIDRKYTEATLRSNISHKIFDNLKFTLRLTGDYSTQPYYWFGSGRARWESFSAMPYDNPYMEGGINGHLTPVMNTDIVPLWYHYTRQNYILERETSKTNEKGFDGTANGELDWRVTDWLRLNTNTRVSYGFTDQSAMFTKDNLEGYTYGGYVEWDYSYGTGIITSNTAHLNRKFGDHTFYGILGQEYNNSNSQYVDARAIGVVAGMTALSSAGTPNRTRGTRSETGFKSYFGQLDYNYQGKYFLVGSLRRDASSRFGPDFKWATFYSVGANWQVSKESFLADKTWIDLMKLKASYGKTGNANIANYLHMGTYQFSDRTAYNGDAGALPSRLPNPALTWESANTLNLGFELGIFRRASFEIDLYNTINTDLLQAVPLSAASGFSSQQRNVGSVRNRGVDLNITTTNLNGLLKWETNLNMNFNRSKVLELADHADIISGSRIIREGLPLEYFYMREWAGVDPATGKPLWVRWEDESGNLLHGSNNTEPTNITTTSVYSDASLLPIESVYPKFTGGMSNDFTYKNFSLNVLTNFAFGHKVYTSANWTVHDLGSNRLVITKWQGWTTWEKPGDIADLPQLLFSDPYNSRMESTFYLFNASYLKIQSIRLGYLFPGKIAGLKNLSLSVSTENLAIITKFPFGDCDTSIESGEAALDRYRPTRKFLFSIRFDI